MQLKFQISQIPQGNSLCTKRKARVINTIFLMRKRKFTTERSPCIQKKPEKSTLCVFVKINHTNLVSWSCGKNELTIRIERKAVHFSSVSINWVAWFGSIVWTSIPASVKEKKRGKKKLKTDNQILYNLDNILRKRWIQLTSWVSDHQQPTQRGTHGADARKYPLLLLCAL